MMRKHKFFLFFFIFLFVLFIFFWGKNAIEYNKDNKMTFIESLIPKEVKVMLKKTVWNKTTRIKIDKIKTKFKYLVFKNKIKSYEVKSRSNTYSIKNFPLPFFSYRALLGKPVAYLEQYKNKIVIVSVDGEFYSFEKNY